MNILGISAFYHDSAACLVQDGEIVAAAQDERYTRKKRVLPNGCFSIGDTVKNTGAQAWT